MERYGPYRDAPCPGWFTPLLHEVCGSTVEDAVTHLDAWRKGVEALVASAGAQKDALVQYLWRVAAQVDTNGNDPVVSLFLAYCCSPVLVAEAAYAPIAYDIAQQAAKAMAMAAATSPQRFRVEAELSDRLQAIIHKFPEYLALWFSCAEWTFNGKEFDLDHLLKIPLGDIAPHVSVSLLEALRGGQARAEDSTVKAHIGDVGNKLAAQHWNRVGEKLRFLWSRDAARAETWNTESIRRMLTFYTVGLGDKDWFDTAVANLWAVLQRVYPPEQLVEAWCECVASFTGRGIDPARALVAVLPDQIALKSLAACRLVLDRAWELCKPADTGLFLALVWYERRLRCSVRNEDDDATRKRQLSVEQRVSNHRNGKVLSWLVERLGELHNENGANVRLGPHEVGAVRSELVERLARSPGLRRAASEFLLWSANASTAADAEQVVMALLTTVQDKAHLRWLQGHPARIVQIRARAVLTLLDGHGEVPADASVRSLSQTAAIINNPRTFVTQPQTWINDQRVEQTLFGAALAAERQFCQEYDDHWATDEEKLISSLLGYMKDQFAKAQQTLQAMAFHGLGAPLHIGLQYREITKAEEGQLHSPTAAHDVDIAFIFRVVEKGFVTATRASLVQAKKLEKTTPTGRWKPSFNIRPDQLDRLADLTQSSFYLFLVPPLPREECWIVPAQFVRSIIAEDGHVTRLLWASAARASRSLAHWLTYEVIGLWTGDERQQIIDRAHGVHPGRKPRFMVEVTISRDDGL